MIMPISKTIPMVIILLSLDEKKTVYFSEFEDFTIFQLNYYKGFYISLKVIKQLQYSAYGNIKFKIQ